MIKIEVNMLPQYNITNKMKMLRKFMILLLLVQQVTSVSHHAFLKTHDEWSKIKEQQDHIVMTNIYDENKKNNIFIMFCIYGITAVAVMVL